MNEQENVKLERFITAVNDEIEAKAAKLLSEAEEEKKRILSEAEAEAEKAAGEFVSESRRKKGNSFVKELSATELEMKKAVLLRREELTNSVFEEVGKRIEEYRKTNSYADGLIKTLLLLSVRDGAEVRLSPDDMKYVPALEKIVKAQGVTFAADSSIKLGGLSVYQPDRGILYDKTYDLALKEQRKEFIASNAFAENTAD